MFPLIFFFLWGFLEAWNKCAFFLKEFGFTPGWEHYQSSITLRRVYDLRFQGSNWKRKPGLQICAVATTFHGHSLHTLFFSPALVASRHYFLQSSGRWWWWWVEFISGSHLPWESPFEFQKRCGHLNFCPIWFGRLFFEMARIVKCPEDKSGFDAQALLNFLSFIFT